MQDVLDEYLRDGVKKEHCAKRSGKTEVWEYLLQLRIFNADEAEVLKIELMKGFGAPDISVAAGCVEVDPESESAAPCTIHSL